MNYYVIVKITLLLLIKITSFSYYVIFVFSQYTRGTRVTRAGQYTRGTRVTRAGQYTRGTRVTRAGQYTRGLRYTAWVPFGNAAWDTRIPGGGERGPRVTCGHVAWKSTHGAWKRRAAWTPRGKESEVPI